MTRIVSSDQKNGRDLNYYSEFVRADYSATPQAQKLGLKLGQRVALILPPTNWTFTDPPDEIAYVLGQTRKSFGG
jgi:hypothetical protein